MSASTDGTLCLWSPELSTANLIGEHFLNLKVSTISCSQVANHIIFTTADDEIIKDEFDAGQLTNSSSPILTMIEHLVIYLMAIATGYPCVSENRADSNKKYCE